MYRIVLCDDNRAYMRKLKKMIEQNKECPSSTVFIMYESAQQLLWSYEGDADMVFLDIRMPGMDGNEAARKLRMRDESVVLVFCTGEVMPSTESFKVQPYRYILKSFSERELKTEIGDCLTEMKKRHRRYYVALTEDGSVCKVMAESMMYLTIIKRGCEVCIEAKRDPVQYKKIITRRRMEEIYEEIRKLGFVSIHKSYVVNMSYIVQVKGNFVVMTDGTQLNVARSKREEFHRRFAEYLGRKYKRERNEKC